MSDFKINTPVVFIIFNRPDTTERVFAEIAKAKPTKLLVVGDGARVGKEDEAEKVAAARAIIDRVDWDCDVLTNFSEINMGCKRRISTGLDWVFEQVEEAIILEDDCLPHSTFFRFCEELLTRYRDDKRISMISGDNFQFGMSVTQNSYYFSKYTHIWGWATWRDRWQISNDVELRKWPLVRDNQCLQDLFDIKHESLYWKKIFEQTFCGKINSWAYGWFFENLLKGRVSVTPNVNLISNIGFGRDDATHTQMITKEANTQTSPIIFPLVHPSFIVVNKAADNYYYRTLLHRSIYKRLRNKITFIIKSLIR
jgi:hypothetical protein